jgi:hypothetical protein
MISDCFDDAGTLLNGLRHLRYLGHDVTVFHILHPDELNFPFDETVRFDGLEDSASLLTQPLQLRASYLQALQALLDAVENGCSMHQCDYFLMASSRPLADALPAYLARRRQRRPGRIQPAT